MMDCEQGAFGDKGLKLNEIAYCKFTVALGWSQVWSFFSLGEFSVDHLSVNIL
jgi:hypothetical protein